MTSWKFFRLTRSPAATFLRVLRVVVVEDAPEEADELLDVRTVDGVEDRGDERVDQFRPIGLGQQQRARVGHRPLQVPRLHQLEDLGLELLDEVEVLRKLLFEVALHQLEVDREVSDDLVRELFSSDAQYRFGASS